MDVKTKTTPKNLAMLAEVSAHGSEVFLRTRDQPIHCGLSARDPEVFQRSASRAGKPLTDLPRKKFAVSFARHFPAGISARAPAKSSESV
jgi:hypothetical protein